MRKKNTVTRARIIEKAIDFFYEKGYGMTSVRDIVRAAGIPNSALYSYFKNKEDLLYNIIRSTGEEFLAGLTNIEKEYSDPLKKLKATISHQVCGFWGRKKETKIYFDELNQLSMKLKNNILKQQRTIYEHYKRQICDLEKLGLLRRVDKCITTFVYLSIMNWCYRWYRDDGQYTLEEVSDLFGDLFLNGIMKNNKRYNSFRGSKRKLDSG